MKGVHLGVGEAFDEDYPNNSHLILSETRLLLDCGYSIPHKMWKYNPDQSFLDAVYISHPHADHYFGLPALLTRMWEEKRTKPLTIICQKELKNQIKDILDYAYKGISKKFGFKLDFIEAKESQNVDFNEFKLSFAPTIHPVSNLAIRISDKSNTMCYSGDGMFTEKAEKLYKDSNLVIHEAFLFDKIREGHAIITDLIEMAKRNSVKCLALTHIQRDCRRNELKKIKDRISREKIKIIIPKPLEEYQL